MKKLLVEKLKFQKLPLNNFFFKKDILLNLVIANKNDRTITINSPKIACDYIKNFEEFFIIIDIKEQNTYILLDKEDYYSLQNSTYGLKNHSKIFLKYNIFPAIDDEVTQTAILENKLFITNTMRIPLLGKKDVISIIDDSIAINI